MRVFLDANVLFSAANANSNIAKLIDLLVKSGSAVTSDFAALEARRNVALKRVVWSKDLETLLAHVEMVPSVRFILPAKLEEKDVPILCAAIRAKCEVLVTGDKRHFGHLYDQTIAGVLVVSPLGLAERLLKTGP